jgi:hypothetical protein
MFVHAVLTMAHVKLILFYLFVCYVCGHLSLPVNDSMDVTGLFSDPKYSSLQNSPNEDILERFKMQQRIQRLALDLIQAKSDNLDLQRKLIVVTNELHRLNMTRGSVDICPGNASLF